MGPSIWPIQMPAKSGTGPVLPVIPPAWDPPVAVLYLLPCFGTAGGCCCSHAGGTLYQRPAAVYRPAILYGAIVSSSVDDCHRLFNVDVQAGTAVDLIPLLFVTHCLRRHLRASTVLWRPGTTSKQLNRETDIRFVGFFGAIGWRRPGIAAISGGDRWFCQPGRLAGDVQRLGQAVVTALR